MQLWTNADRQVVREGAISSLLVVAAGLLVMIARGPATPAHRAHHERTPADVHVTGSVWHWRVGAAHHVAHHVSAEAGGGYQRIGRLR